MCWPENDALEMNKANTGVLAKSISCAASNTIPQFYTGIRSQLSWIQLRRSRNEIGIKLAAVLPLSNKSDYCLNWICPIAVKQMVAVQRCGFGV